MDGRLRALMLAQEGAFSAAQAAVVGVTPNELAVLCRRREITRVRRGAFVDTERYDRGFPDQRFRLRVVAVLLSRGGQDPASHHAALAVHGLPLADVDLGRIDVLGEVAKPTRCGEVRVHPRAGLTTVTTGPVSAVSVPRALIQTAAEGVEPGVVAADAALRSRRWTVADLEKELCEGPAVRGHRRARRMMSLVDPRSESVGESRIRLVLVAAGHEVRSQVTVVDRGAFLARVDLLVAGRVVVEFDGAVKYADDASGRTLFAEKKREDRLRELGFEVVRVTWTDLAHPEVVLQRVRAALSRAAVRLGEPGAPWPGERSPTRRIWSPGR
jgi:very-short-patch-repair endonuclease